MLYKPFIFQAIIVKLKTDVCNTLHGTLMADKHSSLSMSTFLVAIKKLQITTNDGWYKVEPLIWYCKLAPNKMSFFWKTQSAWCRRTGSVTTSLHQNRTPASCTVHLDLPLPPVQDSCVPHAGLQPPQSASLQLLLAKWSPQVALVSAILIAPLTVCVLKNNT